MYVTTVCTTSSKTGTAAGTVVKAVAVVAAVAAVELHVVPAVSLTPADDGVDAFTAAAPLGATAFAPSVDGASNDGSEAAPAVAGGGRLWIGLDPG